MKFCPWNRRFFVMTRRNWDSEPKTHSEQQSTRKRDKREWRSDAFPRQQVSAAMFGQARMDKHPSLTREGKLAAHATPWAKQFRGDIEALTLFDESDVFVRELQGDLRKVFSHVDSFCALDPERRQRQEEVTERETHKTLQLGCCAKERQRCLEVLRYGLKLYTTRITISNLCPMCENRIFEIGNSANSRSKSF